MRPSASSPATPCWARAHAAADGCVRRMSRSCCASTTQAVGTGPARSGGCWRSNSGWSATLTAEPRRLRILMVLESEFPVARGGGSEIQLRTLGEALRRRGHRVTVLTPRLALGPQATAGRHFGLAVGRLAYPRIRVLGGLVMLARMALFLRGHGKRYDAVHVHIAHHLALVCCAVAPTVGQIGRAHVELQSRENLVCRL